MSNTEKMKQVVAKVDSISKRMDSMEGGRKDASATWHPAFKRLKNDFARYEPYINHGAKKTSLERGLESMKKDLAQIPTDDRDYKKAQEMVAKVQKFEDKRDRGWEGGREDAVASNPGFQKLKKLHKDSLEAARYYKDPGLEGNITRMKDILSNMASDDPKRKEAQKLVLEVESKNKK